MQKRASHFTITMICCVTLFYTTKADTRKITLEDRLVRIEKKIDALSEKICNCDPKKMMEKMQPMHEKMMEKMKDNTKKSVEKKTLSPEEHKEHHTRQTNNQQQ